MFQVPTFEEINLFAAAPVILLAVWASVLLVVDRFIVNKYYVAVLSLLGVGLSLLIALFQAGDLFGIGDPGTAFEGMFVADQFTFVVNVAILLGAAFGILISYDYLERTGLDRGEYYILLLFAAVGGMLMGSTNHLVMIFIALELLSIPLYILAGIRRPQEESEESAMKYFLLGAFASAFLVYGIVMLFGATGSLDLTEIWQTASTLNQAERSTRFLLFLGVGMVLVGLGFKVAAVPFHMWTPDVYQGAPTPVTAYMSVVAKTGGFAALLRVMITGLSVVSEGENAALWVNTVQIIAIATLVVGNIVAIMQSDLKRLLAYSSIAHAGYILIAVAAGGVVGFGDEAARAALIYVIAYTFTNIGAFAVIVAIEKDDSTGTGMKDIKGLAKDHPQLALAMTIFMFSLTGIPLTAGFVGKFFVFQSAIEADLTLLAVVGVLTSVVSAFYYIRVIWNMWLEAPDGDLQVSTAPMLRSALLIAALATFVFGITAQWLQDLVQNVVIAVVR
jgi:NADH-quinone oxidoreductase subunit N